MAKEGQRIESRERMNRTEAAEKDASAAESQSAGPASGEKRWLQPIRAALPKLKALRGKMMIRTPRVDVIERDEDVVVRAAVAGIPKDVIDVAVSNGTLTIRGTAPQAEEQGEYAYHELPHGGFERRLSLPCAVQVENAAASIRDGMLELILPKAEAAKSQLIAIR
jgi:HSP20 family protein